MCLAMNDFWVANGYLAEASRWLERAVKSASGTDSVELAKCMSLLARKLRLTDELGRAYELALSSREMARGLDNGTSAELMALYTLAALDGDRDNVTEARTRYEEAISLAREIGDRLALFGCLADYAAMETSARNYNRSLELGEQALDVAHAIGHTVGALITQHNIGWTLLEMNRVDEAADQMRRVIDQALDLDEPSMLLPQALDFAVVLERLGENEYAVLLLGATDAGYDSLGVPPYPVQREDRSMLMARTRSVMPEEEWDTAYEAGLRTPIEDALRAVADLPG
jgi:tetratricopeptide (TPR) repeat protein